MAISALASGLLPITMSAIRFHERIGYHDYEGVSLDVEERQRIVADLGPHMAMILRNHGLLTCGRTITARHSRRPAIGALAVLFCLFPARSHSARLQPVRII